MKIDLGSYRHPGPAVDVQSHCQPERGKETLLTDPQPNCLTRGVEDPRHSQPESDCSILSSGCQQILSMTAQYRDLCTHCD